MDKPEITTKLKKGFAITPQPVVPGWQSEKATVKRIVKAELKSEQLRTKYSGLLTTAFDYLTDEKLLEKLEDSKIKDVAIAMGIWTDHLHKAQPVVKEQLSLADHTKLDTLAPALLAEIQRRGLTVTATERKVTIDAPATPVRAVEVLDPPLEGDVYSKPIEQDA